MSWVAFAPAVATRFAADAALEAQETALEHDGGEFPEPGLEALPAVGGFTNVLYHTLDYIKKKYTCPALLQGFLRFWPIPVQLRGGFKFQVKRPRR